MSHETSPPESTPPAAEHPAQPAERSAAPKPPGKHRKLFIVLGVVGACVAVIFLIPWVLHSMHTVSTDDAYVNS